jgi:hypothetical protein
MTAAAKYAGRHLEAFRSRICNPAHSKSISPAAAIFCRRAFRSYSSLRCGVSASIPAAGISGHDSALNLLPGLDDYKKISGRQLLIQLDIFIPEPAQHPDKYRLALCRCASGIHPAVYRSQFRSLQPDFCSLSIPAHRNLG